MQKFAKMRMINKMDNKREFIENLLEGESVMIHVRPQMDGCIVPEHLEQLATVSLNISHYFRRPLHIDNEKICAELLFDNIPFICEFPWNTIWACTSISGEHTFWPENLPLELELLMQDIQAEKKVKEKKASITQLKTKSSTKKNTQKKRKASHLKLVK